MKVTYEFETWSKVALNRSKFCPNCGGHSYKICHQIKPATLDFDTWHIECPDCGFEGPTAYNKKLAMTAWKEC